MNLNFTTVINKQEVNFENQYVLQNISLKWSTHIEADGSGITDLSAYIPAQELEIVFEEHNDQTGETKEKTILVWINEFDIEYDRSETSSRHLGLIPVKIRIDGHKAIVNFAAYSV